jgi:predicted lipoprotein
MTSRVRRPSWRPVLWTGAIIGLLALVRPWTVRPIEPVTSRPFSASAYVDGIWEQKVLPYATTAAVAAEAVPPSASRSLFVRGDAIVDRVDVSSRVGLAHLRLPAASRPVALQIGPVIRGTAVRDALDFIRFTDFTNQIEFAGVANALNDRALRSVREHVDPATLAGARIAFVGAASVDGPGTRLDVVPVELSVVRGAP